MPDFVPPSEVFEIPPKPPAERLAEGSYSIPGATGEATRTKDGEMCTVFSGFPHPRKGAIYPEAIDANNEVKRRTLSTFAPFACKEIIPAFIGFLLTPFSWKIRFAEKFLTNYLREVDYIYLRCTRVPYLKKEYYNNCSKALWDAVSTFLCELGFSAEVSERLGKVVATLFEYDDLYRLYIEDPMRELTREEALASPRKFIDKFVRLAKERDVQSNPKTGQPTGIPSITHKKIADLGRLLGILLLVPRVRRAFRKAIAGVRFEWLQLDEIERFWNLNRYDYDLEGRPFDTRMLEYAHLQAQHAQKVHGGSGYEITKNPETGLYDYQILFYEKTSTPPDDKQPAPLVES